MKKSKHLRMITFIGIMTALSVILTRFVPIISTPTIRVTLGNIPIILTSIVFGPIAGTICALLADFIGSVLSGYLPFVPLLLTPMLTGLLPGLIFNKLYAPGEVGGRLFFTVFASLFIGAYLPALFWTPMGLHFLSGVDYFVTILARFPFSSLQSTIEILALFLLLKTKILERIR